jgi:hypothetical protein
MIAEIVNQKNPDFFACSLTACVTLNRTTEADFP